MRSFLLLFCKQKPRVLIARIGLSIVAPLLSGCAGLAGSSLPTPFSTGYLPTVIALTAEAAQPASTTLENPALPPTSIPVSTIPETITPIPLTPTPTNTSLPTGSLPAPVIRIPTITPTPNPGFPNAEIEFLGMGPLSRVTSPIHLSAYLKTWADGHVIVELLGEDRRLLFREVKAMRGLPDGAWVPLRVDMDYEVAAAAEAGRLQISVEDKQKRITALNSMPLILLSIGEPDLLPAQDPLAPIIIQKPGKRALIQGGKVLVSGLIRGTPEQPVLVRLLNPKGGEVGSRIASLQFPPEGGYGTFQVEVPYTVSQPTDALLVVTQGEAGINDVIHLTSMDVMLAP
jgi:hypothetical protein